MKTAHKAAIREYMVKPHAIRKKVDWRDYVIPTGNKKKRRISAMIDKIVYGT